MAQKVLTQFKTCPLGDQKKFYSARGQKLRPQGQIKFLGYEKPYGTPGITTSHWTFINSKNTNTMSHIDLPDIISSSSEDEGDVTDDELEIVQPPNKKGRGSSSK